MSTSSSDLKLNESRFTGKVNMISPLTQHGEVIKYYFRLRNAMGSKLQFIARGNTAIRLSRSVRVGMHLEVSNYTTRLNRDNGDMEAYLDTESEIYEMRRHIL
ncbi:hypothetical protein TKK_0014490 [Trichogramma kaykai]